jgi:hypothetical protein
MSKPKMREKAQNDDGTFPKPRGRAPLNEKGEAAEWYPKKGECLDLPPKKKSANKRKLGPSKKISIRI